MTEERAAKRHVVSTPERRVVTAAAAHVARRIEAAAREGFEPERVTLRARGGADGGGVDRVDDLEVEVVLVRRDGAPSAPDAVAGSMPVAPDVAPRRRVLVGPVPFRDGDRLGITHAPRPHDRGWITSVAVAGEARDDEGRGLVIAFVWCVDPQHLVPWGLHLHALAGDAFHRAPSVQVLAAQGALVQAHPVALPAGRGTLSLWHGREGSPRPPVASGERAVDPLEAWVVRHMERIASRHAQLVVVRDGEVVACRAFARDGAARAAGDEVTAGDEAGDVGEAGEGDLDRALRLGSVSKVVTGLVAAGVARRLGWPRGLDTALGDLDVLRSSASATLRTVTVAQLLDHTAGLVTSPDLRADDEQHPLSELRIARALGRPDAPLRPGDLLRWFEEEPDDRAFVRPPGSGRPEYGNDGAILLGELLSRLVLGRDDRFEVLVERLFAACGVDVGDRGCLLGAGLARSIARREATPRPTSITWAPARFDPDLEVVTSPHGDNGPYLGGAAGLAVPLAWMGAVLAAIGRRDADPEAPTRADLDALTAPSPRDPRFGRGVMRGAPTYLTLRRGGAPAARPVRVLPLHHLGRIDGGSALLLHLLPIDPADGTGLAAVVAFDRLGPLDPAIEGAELLAVLRGRATS